MGLAERRAVLAGLREIAERQHGVLLYRQIRASGMSRDVLDSLLREGWLVRARHGAYVVGAVTPSSWQQAVAALLLAGPDAALSHSTAATLHRMPGVAPTGRIELTVTTVCHPRLPGTQVHRVRSLEPGDVGEWRGLAVTTPSRTLVDLAPRLSSELLASVVDEGSIAGLWTPDLLDEAARAAWSRPGMPALRAVLADRAGEPVVDSMFEMRVARALRPLTPFVVHHQVDLEGRSFILDVAWPEVRVAAECDGWHVRSRSRTKFDHDRRRGNLLVAHGWLVVHLTARMSDAEMLSAVERVLVARRTSFRA